jgi:hypothetical protein
VRGISASILALILGCWILYHRSELFRTPAWANLYAVIGGNVSLVAWPILIGGLCGIAGLFVRARLLSLASCVIGIFWFAWMGGFLGYANLQGTANIAAIFCVYGFLEYVYRFILLAARPKPGESYGEGW